MYLCLCVFKHKVTSVCIRVCVCVCVCAQSSSLFSQLIELLVSRLPRSVSASVARRLTGFAAAETLPGVQSALSSVLAETAQHHPQVVINEFVRPTLESITRDLAGSGGLQGMHEISSALEGTLCHKVSYAVHMARLFVFQLWMLGCGAGTACCSPASVPASQ